MARDIKKMMQNYNPEGSKLSQEHEARFEARLKKTFSDEIFHEKKTSFSWLKVAAIAIVLIGVGFLGYQKLAGPSSSESNNLPKAMVVNEPQKSASTDEKNMTLADISPDLKKVEEYYMTGINVQLASLKITDENRDVVDGYMQRLATLDKEYSALNAELAKVGPTESTVTALIDNLKLRLDLLFKLKNKLKELKNQENDQFETIQS